MRQRPASFLAAVQLKLVGDGRTSQKRANAESSPLKTLNRPFERSCTYAGKNACLALFRPIHFLSRVLVRESVLS